MPSEYLSAKVAALNTVNAAINHYAPIVLNALRQFPGKAYLKTGEKSKQFDALVESFNLPKGSADGKPIRVQILKNYGELTLKVSTFYATKHSDSNDCSDSLWIGRITADGTIDLRIYKDENPAPLKTDYSAEIIEKKRNQIAELEKQIAEINKSHDIYKFQGF
jgi:hypothetical protein